jgi:hypothetical protein
MTLCSLWHWTPSTETSARNLLNCMIQHLQMQSARSASLLWLKHPIGQGSAHSKWQEIMEMTAHKKDLQLDMDSKLQLPISNMHRIWTWQSYKTNPWGLILML